MKLKDANKLFRDGQIENAISAYLELAKTKPSFAIFQNLSILYLKKKDIEKSFFYSKKSKEILISRSSPNHESRTSAKISEQNTHTNQVTQTSCEDFWLKHIENDANLSWFIVMAKRIRSVNARNLICLAATKKHYTYDALELILESYRINHFRKNANNSLANVIIPKYWLELARLIYSQQAKPFDKLNAKTIYDIAINKSGLNILTGVDKSYFSVLSAEFGHILSARKVLQNYPTENNDRSIDHQFLIFNTYNPNNRNSKNSIANWLSRINKIYIENKLSPITIDEKNDALFYRLSSPTSVKIIDNDIKLSVLMPVYEPDSSTITAIRSILNQTWQNLELIIVDDASPLSLPTIQTLEKIEEISKTDQRVKIIKSETNRGAYWARNLAFQEATGKYVTVADKDDWHHPDKFNLQITDLEKNPNKVANMVSWVRVDKNLNFLLRWGPDRVSHPSFASLMIRHQQVKKDLGFWDCVRKSGDGEFKMRLQKFYGVKLEPLSNVPLAFSLMSEGNLTAEDLGMGFQSNDRLAYLVNFEYWHKISPKNELYLSFPPEGRNFPAPCQFLPERREQKKYDVVFLSEFGFEAGNKTILLNEIKSCIELGLKVGVIMLQNFLIKTAAVRHTSPEIQELLMQKTVDRLTLDDRDEIELLIIRWPAILQYTSFKKSNLKSKNIVIIANHAPYDKITDRRSYDITTITNNVTYLFNKIPIWAPESEQILEIIKNITPAEILDVRPWKGILIGPANIHRKFFFDRQPVIGRHARDAIEKWPATKEEFRSIYLSDSSFKVCILGGASTPIKQGFAKTEEISDWKIYPFGSKKSSEYLDEIDFFVYFHHSEMVEAFGMAILEALQRGSVCILPANFSKVFKDAAVYCNPTEVKDKIIDLWSNPEKFLSQQKRGFDYFENHGSINSFKNNLCRFIKI